MKPRTNQIQKIHQIHHVNPKCLDARFCLPHSEHEGPVFYDWPKVFDYLHLIEDKK